MSNTEAMRNLLIIAATSVGDALAQAGIDSKDWAFSLVIWPAGYPEHCSSICGSGDMVSQADSPTALASAALKAREQPTHISSHTSLRKPN